MLPKIISPSEVLTQKSKPVDRIDASVKKLLAEMKETLDTTRDPEGVGLAAPQVGKSLRIFLIKPTQKDKAEVFINPEIISMQEIPQAVKGKRKKGTSKLEGCLSLPNIWGVVHRSSEVTVSYLDENGKKHKKTFRGFPAVIIQHEYDHLQGILFPKRVLEQHEKLYKSSKDKKGEDIFEEMEI